MQRAFILSDCDYPECQAKPHALLTANPTRGHHFIAQTEQRQHAFNPQVNPQNQNVYCWPLSLLHKPYRGKVLSVNIEGNLEAPDLYTLTHLEGSEGKQYNLENWFNRHESGHEESCNSLRVLPSGRQKVPRAMWRVLQLKLLDVLRNPYNRSSLFVHHLHQVLSRHLPQISSEFTALIAARADEDVAPILQTFGFTFDEYTAWLANLYGMLSEGVHHPSLFERLFASLFACPGLRLELYRYDDAAHCAFFADSGYCLQASAIELSIGFSVSADMFAIVHISRGHWQHFAIATDAMPPQLSAEINVHDNNHIQRITYNHLCVHQAHEAVYGKSALRSAYF